MYRVGYRVLQVIWFVTRPEKRGVKCLVTDRDRVLLVRHTYGRRDWDIPGGLMKRGEAPLTAAHREMSEELGLDGVQWSDIGRLSGSLDHRRDRIYCFRTEVFEPRLTLDPGELAVAEWFSRGALPSDLAPYVDAIVANAPVTES